MPDLFGAPAAVPAPFSHTRLDRGGAGGDLMLLCGGPPPQTLTWYGASTVGARARRNYDRIMNNPR